MDMQVFSHSTFWKQIYKHWTVLAFVCYVITSPAQIMKGWGVCTPLLNLDKKTCTLSLKNEITCLYIRWSSNTENFPVFYVNVYPSLLGGVCQFESHCNVCVYFIIEKNPSIFKLTYFWSINTNNEN